MDIYTVTSANKKIATTLYLITVLIAIAKIVVLLFVGWEVVYPDEQYYFSLAEKIAGSNKTLYNNYLPAYNWGYVLLNVWLNKVDVKAIYVLNILMCMLLKLKFIQYALRSSDGFLLFVPVFLLGLDYFSMFNLKDTVLVLFLFFYFTLNSRFWKLLIIALIFPVRIYLAVLLVSAELSKVFSNLSRKIKALTILTILLISAYFFPVLNTYVQEFKIIVENSMSLTASHGYGMSGVNVLTVKGFLVGFVRFIFTPLPIGFRWEFIDTIKLDSILLFLVYVYSFTRVKWRNLLYMTEFYLVVYLTAFYALQPFLAVPRHKYMIVIPIILMLHKSYVKERSLYSNL